MESDGPTQRPGRRNLRLGRKPTISHGYLVGSKWVKNISRVKMGENLPQVETNKQFILEYWLEDTCFFLLGPCFLAGPSMVSFREFFGKKSVVKSKMLTRTFFTDSCNYPLNSTDSYSCDFSFNIYRDSMSFPLKTPVPLIDMFTAEVIPVSMCMAKKPKACIILV